MTSKNKLYDFSNRDHNEVKTLSRQIAALCEDRNINGMIVIISTAKGSGTQVFSAGMLSNKDKVVVASAKLHLATLIEMSEEE